MADAASVLQKDLAAARQNARTASSGVSAVRLGSLPVNSEQDRRLIQDRLALFSKTAFFITTMFLVTNAALDAALDDGLGVGDAAFASHVLAASVALVIWQLARRQVVYSPAVLKQLDALGTILVSVSFVLMGHFLPQPYGFYTALLAILHVNVGRAAMVPSEPGRTLAIGVASLAGLVVSRALLPLAPGLAYPDALRVRWLVEAALWSLAGTGVAGLSSLVIYGLHERALEARQLGQYELEEKIGAGGMGEIYRARHAMLRRPTAVKLLSGNGSEEQLRRFEREVQLTARLTHPNTISIYDYGRTPDGVFYYAMELLDGLTLEQLIERHGPASPARTIHILQQACGALAEAHGIGLIHRDIKPANIHLCTRGGARDVVKVLDFGLVRELPTDASATGSSTGSNLNVVVGTPLYLSPEAILSGSRVDARADLYGLGSVAYFLLTGSPPFSGANLVEICGHHLHSVPAPPSQRWPVPEDLERIVLACLSKEPSQRPQSATALLEALSACSDAGAWSAADADAWWAGHETASQRAPAPAPEDVRQRKTVCHVDLERRLTPRTRSA
jgi:eukaryotic-like serine/threonine-protein kinase